MIFLNVKSDRLLRLTSDKLPSEKFYVELYAADDKWSIYVPDMHFGGTFKVLLLIELVKEADRMLKTLTGGRKAQ